jgi:hypothetical protein
MPIAKGNKIGVTVFLNPETYRRMEESRNPYVSKSAFCAMALEEVFGVSRN